MSSDPKALIREWEQEKANRMNWDTIWQETAERILPRLAEFNVERSEGEKRTEKIFDATPALALDRFGSVVESMLTPRNQQWHRTRASDRDLMKIDRVNQWFEDYTKVLFQNRYASRANFGGQSYEAYISLGAFGQGPIFVDEGKNEFNVPSGTSYTALFMGNTWFKTDIQNRVHTVFRRLNQSLQSLVDFFATEDEPGEAFLSQRARDMFAKEPNKKIEVLHVVGPRAHFDRDRRDSANMPFFSSYIEVEEKHEIKVGGFEEFPFPISRYLTAPSETYARSPASIVLPDIKSLNQMNKMQLNAAARAISPPIMMPSDTTGQKFNLAPGKLNKGFVTKDGKQLAIPFTSGERLDIGEDQMQRRRDIINAAFLVDLFQILTERPQMTATEVLERAQEKAQLLGPVMGRQQSEFLGPLIERETGILFRQGKLPEMPPELIEAEGEYEIEYVSPLALAQRSQDVQGTLRTIEATAPLAEVQPEMWDNFNGDEMVRITGRAFGMPEKILRDEEEVEVIREQRAQAQQIQQAAELAPGLTQANKNLAEAENIS